MEPRGDEKVRKGLSGFCGSFWELWPSLEAPIGTLSSFHMACVYTGVPYRD